MSFSGQMGQATLHLIYEQRIGIVRLMKTTLIRRFSEDRLLELFVLAYF
jgi:hypothetical protein